MLHLIFSIAACDPIKPHSEMSLFSVALNGPRLWATSAACMLFCGTFSVCGCIELLDTHGFSSLYSKHKVVKPLDSKLDTELSTKLGAIHDATPKVGHSLLSSSELSGPMEHA